MGTSRVARKSDCPVFVDLPLASPPSCLARPWAPVAGGCFPSSSCFLLTFLSLCLRSSPSFSLSLSRGARFFLLFMSSLSAPSDCTQRDSTFFRTFFSMLSRIRKSCLPDGIDEPLVPPSRMSSTVVGHFLRYELRRFPKYDDDAAGSTEARTLGSGVVFRLRGGCEGLEPGLVAFPLLPRPGGAILDVSQWVVGVCGEGSRVGARQTRGGGGSLEATGVLSWALYGRRACINGVRSRRRRWWHGRRGHAWCWQAWRSGAC